MKNRRTNAELEKALRQQIALGKIHRMSAENLAAELTRERTQVP